MQTAVITIAGRRKRRSFPTVRRPCVYQGGIRTGYHHDDDSDDDGGKAVYDVVVVQSLTIPPVLVIQIDR